MLSTTLAADFTPTPSTAAPPVANLTCPVKTSPRTLNGLPSHTFDATPDSILAPDASVLIVQPALSVSNFLFGASSFLIDILRSFLIPDLMFSHNGKYPYSINPNLIAPSNSVGLMFGFASFTCFLTSSPYLDFITLFTADILDIVSTARFIAGLT